MTRLPPGGLTEVGQPPPSGGQPRVLPGVPLRALIVDDRLAVRFSDAGSGEPAGSTEDLDRVILRLLAAGLTDQAVARQLSLSQRTVQRHVATLMTRLGARTRLQAGVQGSRQGWL
jgi:DNA-binding NarL/FixJ family response regulator